MRIEEFRQTVFINKDDLNLVRFSFPESEYTPGNRFYIEITVGDEVVLRDECFDRINEVFLPLVKEDTPACLTVTQEGESPVKHPFILKNVKKWTFCFVTSSHEDLGYCSWVNRLDRECADYTEAVLDLIERDKRFKYMIEHCWWQRGFDNYASKEQKERFKKYICSGNIELNSPTASDHTHWQSEEVLIRSLYPAFKGVGKYYGISPKTAFYADISGMTWGSVSAYTHVGIKYAGIAENRYLRFSTDDEELPQIFWWLAPNGKDRLLCMHQNGYRPRELSSVICDTKRQYREDDFIFDQTKINRAQYAVDSMIEKLGDVKYDLYPCVFYDDHEFPTTMLLKVCDGLDKEWKYPAFKMATPSECLSYIEDNFGDTLPIKSGDWSEQWADFATIAPNWMSTMRSAQRLLPVAETVSVIAALKDKKEYPMKKIKDSVWGLCEFDDHCWATSSKHPQEMHKFNLNLVKKHSADFAYSTLKGIIDNAITASPAEGQNIKLWNLLLQNSYSHLEYEGDYAIEKLICQKLPDGKVITEPVELPPCGFDLYKKAPAKRIEGVKEISESSFETPFYIVKYDSQIQRVLSIKDKQTDRELIDQNSTYGLCEFLYINTETKHERGFSVEHAQARSFKVYRGKLATSICITAYEEQLAANISVSMVFYEKEKNIDIECKFKNAVGLMGDYYDRYKKNIFWAFPFSVPSHRFYTEIAGSIVDERTDRMPTNPHDFVCAKNWVAAENDDGGIALYSADMPIFHLGDIHYNEISSKTDFSASSNVFLYAASNRCNNLNYVSKEECCGEYRISVLPYEGRCADTVPFWSDLKSNPPIIAVADSESKPFSFMGAENRNIRMTCCKLCEDGGRHLVLRFAETGGRNTVTKLRLPECAKSVCYADGAETPYGKALPVKNNTVEFETTPFSYTTLLLALKDGFELKPEPDDNKPIKSVFTFEYESDKTLVCFKKKEPSSIERIKIYADGVLKDTIKSDSYYTQFSVLDILDIKEIKLEVHLKDGSVSEFIHKCGKA